MTISAQSISLEWSDGTVAFKDISFSLQPGFHALVGANGCGKSSLVKVLAGDAVQPRLEATSGQLHRTGSIGYVGQHELSARGSLADYLEVKPLLSALQRIAQGSVVQTDFDTVGERWTFADELKQQLEALNLWREAVGFNMPVAQLSGGERTRLRLFKAFYQAPDNLILDEPSNHLDEEGRAWLLHQCQLFCAQPQRCLLVVSHDRSLLQHVESVSELNALGIQHFRGNYDDYASQVAQHRLAAERQLQAAVKHKKQLQQQVQRTKEKAEKRQAKGKGDRAKGGQAKVLLDAAKERSQHTTRTLATQMARQQEAANLNVSQAEARIATGEDTRINFANTAALKRKRLLHAEQLVLPFGASEPLTFTLGPNDKLRLCGVNGSGKSTLLKVLTGQLKAAGGKLQLNTRVHLLDQQFSLIDPGKSALDNLLGYVAGLSVTEARTALAQAGLSGHIVLHPAYQLSGGETMKLAMLMVTLQAQPELLLFDEPDNHLDIPSKAQLASAIRTYPGALVLVSHDDHFVEAAGITALLALAR